MEVVIAVLVLSVGLLGLVAGAAMTTRMIGQGRRFGEVSALAGQRLERLRSVSCADMGGGTEQLGPYRLEWAVQVVAGGRARELMVVVASPTTRRIRSDTFATTVLC